LAPFLIVETLAVIDAGPGKFMAGIVLWDDTVIEAADIVGYMKRNRWTRDRVRTYCAQRGWKVSVVHQITRKK
jgi:hypothetical protein